MKTSFRTILILITLMVVGTVTIPLLSVQLYPSQQNKGFSIDFQWQGASAKLIEAQVTSRLESTLATVAQVNEISSISQQNQGSVHVVLKEHADVDAVRFEVSTKLRSLYEKLPKEVSYPVISTGIRSQIPVPILTYAVNADLPTWEIQRMVRDRLIRPISIIKGIEQVEVSGATPYEWVVEFDAVLCDQLGISIRDITSAVQQNGLSESLAEALSSDGTLMQVVLSGPNLKPDDWQKISVKNIDGRLVTLADVAVVEKRERLPTAYHRINGSNNVNVTVYAMPSINTIDLSDRVKAVVDGLELPSEYAISLMTDSSDYIRKELSKIYSRAGLSLLILLVFVFIMSRSWRYVLLIATTLFANVLIAFVFYNIFRVDIHIYTLAGITVSLGIVIDTSIMMLDHYSRFANRRVFIAMLAGLLSTIGALSIVWLLPDELRDNMQEFALVIMINLIVSLFISYFFIPALVEKFPIWNKKTTNNLTSKRTVVRLSHAYSRFLTFSRKYRWFLLLIAILGFGIPIHRLPNKLTNASGLAVDSTLSPWQRVYNNSIGSSFYQYTLKPYLEPMVGGALRLFDKNIFSRYQSSDSERTTLYIEASMQEGCTIHQLDTTIRKMEGFLVGLDDVDVFRTSIEAYDRGIIAITFTEYAQQLGRAIEIKEDILLKARALGGADWYIYGVGADFSNHMRIAGRSNSIKLCGYNYDHLYQTCRVLVDSVSANRRVASPIIVSNDANQWPRTEFFMNFQHEAFAASGVSREQYFLGLNHVLFSAPIGQYYDGMNNEDIKLISSNRDGFDRWFLTNDVLPIVGQQVKLNQFGAMRKSTSGNDIVKYNQEYTLSVAFDYIGPTEQALQFEMQQIERLRSELPVGYSVSASDSRPWGAKGRDRDPTILLLIVVVIIFMNCAILFESLIQPLVIILLIPISYIGVFLTFALFNLPFDQGGFASFVLLAGLVVNAGIYLVNEYNTNYPKDVHGNSNMYVRCYNRKIIPILMTIVSTVLGLLPFVIISREPFWYSFAVGVIGGLIFSILAIVIYLPVFLPFKQNRKS